MSRYLAAVLFLPALACAQEMVKVNMLALYERVPAPPVSVEAALARHECREENMSLRCAVDKFYQPIEGELNALGEQCEKLSFVLSAPVPSSMQQMDAEEIRKKMEKMSDAEKIQFAMAMTQQMGFGARALTPESEEVIAAQEEHARLSEKLALEMQDHTARYRKQTDLKLARERQHEEVNTWYAAEHKKIPLVSYGEVGRLPDIKAEYALKLAATEKHLAVENAYLQDLLKHWPEEIAHLKALYGPFQEKLAAIDYGEEAENVETKRLFVGGQASMLGSVESLIKLSRAATEEAITWWLSKKELEKQKPQE